MANPLSHPGSLLIEIPKAAICLFHQEALKNHGPGQELNELWAYLIGYTDGVTHYVTEIVFPSQTGDGGNVVDEGIFGNDTLMWIKENSASANKYGSAFRLISWVHSHVRGAVCGLSSIDVHTQFVFEQIYGNVVALVFEMRDDGSSFCNAFRLTEIGLNEVAFCSRTRNVSSVQHEQCSAKNLFFALDPQPKIVMKPLEAITDGRNRPVGDIDRQEFLNVLDGASDDTEPARVLGGNNKRIVRDKCQVSGKGQPDGSADEAGNRQSRKSDNKVDLNEQMNENVDVAKVGEGKARLAKVHSRKKEAQQGEKEQVEFDPNMGDNSALGRKMFRRSSRIRTETRGHSKVAHKCYACLEKFGTFVDLQEHIKNTKKCFEEFLRQVDLRSSIIEDPRKKSLADRNKEIEFVMFGRGALKQVVVCNGCDTLHRSQKALIIHVSQNQACHGVMWDRLTMLRCIAAVHDEKKRLISKDSQAELGKALYSCARCQKVFKKAHLYKKHLLGTADCPLGARTKYQCDRCKKKFISKKGYKNHPNKICTPAKRKRSGAKCDQCGKYFETDYFFRKHLGLSRNCNSKNSKVAGGNRMCNRCGKIFRSLYYFRRHERMALNCNDKNRSLAGGEDAVATRRGSNDQQKAGLYVCSRCGKRFRRYHFFKKHIVKLPLCPLRMDVREVDEGGGEKNTETCSVCLKVTKSMSGLLRHLSTSRECAESMPDLMANNVKKHKDMMAEKRRVRSNCTKYIVASRERSHIRRKVGDILCTERDRNLKFHDVIKDGPVYPCVCCHRLVFNHSVKSFACLDDLKATITEELYSKSIAAGNQFQRNKFYHICGTCFSTITKKKTSPSLSSLNGLQLDVIPEALKLTELEQQLIARNLLFLKIRKLPRTRMESVIDKVINVPLEADDIANTVSTLPRALSAAGLITVQLKRMKNMKNTHNEALIRPEKLRNAIHVLKRLENPYYRDVVINDQFEHDSRQSDPDTWNSLVGGTIQLDEMENSKSDEELEGAPDDTLGENDSGSEISDSGDAPILDAVTKFQAGNVGSSCMVPNNPDTRVVLNESRSVIEKTVDGKKVAIAPGEGKIPTNWLKEPNFDVKSYPGLHPTGRFGLDFKRELKLTTQAYFTQRLVNVDNRFRNDTSYLFAAQQRVERESLERQIDVCFQRGKLTTEGSNIVVNQGGDHFSCFQKIRGTPKYWQKVRLELLAKIKQLGPFQLFFTLSCAEMRWPEIIANILGANGSSVVFGSKWDGNNSEVFIDELPLDEYISKYDIKKGELLRENVFLVTRMFDIRVKAFVNQIILGKGIGTFRVEYFSYRIEFQVRGMAHVHGVMWLEPDYLVQFRNSRDNSFDDVKLVSLIDSVITCALPGNKNPVLNEIVKNVQTHSHTKSCRKNNGTCRFNYPRFPSLRTIIAKPLEGDLVEDIDMLKKEARDILADVKLFLSDKLEPNMSLMDVLSSVNHSLEKYEWALSVSQVGKNIILKRSVAEININNYNSEWLLAWNGNMDLQFCCDPYAVVTYVTDYFTKDDSGMTDVLKAAVNQTQGLAGRQKMHVLKNAYLSHRQIGACEAIYRLFPSMLLKNSNITCNFVNTGFKENRSRFMRKVPGSDESDNIDPVELDLCGTNKDELGQDNLFGEPSVQELEDGQTIAESSNQFTIDGRKGKFIEAETVHDKYSSRPISLEKMTLAQFAIYYTTGRRRKGIEFVENSSVESSEHCIYGTSISMPAYIQVLPESDKAFVMSCRRNPCVLRLHDFRKKTSSHESCYSELLLYHPWRDEETDLCRYHEVACMRLFSHFEDKILEVKRKIFPFGDLHDQLDLANFSRPEHIGDNIDAAGEQDNADADEEFVAENEKFSIHHPGNVVDCSDWARGDGVVYKYREIDIANRLEMDVMVRALISEQRQAFDRVIKFCKQIIMRRTTASDQIMSLNIVMTGGAGTGKSQVVKCMTKWAEKLLRKAGDHPNKPRVLITAPTGMAASLIGGATIHSALNLNYGDDLAPLSDKKLDEARNHLKDLKLLIVDEISMVRSDMLHQIHLRLSQVFQSDQSFGGIGVVLVGDLLQLQPVRGRFIFQSPHYEPFAAYHAIDPLWEQFTPVMLNHNHRQGKEKMWADTLNNIRIGLVTSDDETLLRSRIINDHQQKQMVDALHLFFTNKEVTCHNNHLLNKLEGTLISVCAIMHGPIGHKPSIDKVGRIDETAFLFEFKFKIGARVMVINNIDTLDGLTNGVMGTVLAVERSRGEIRIIIVQFDNLSVGVNSRADFGHICRKYGDHATGVQRSEFQYQLPKYKGKSGHAATAKVYQFPLRLAWAVTAHKVQGQTFIAGTKVVVHWSKLLKPGMAYVMLGRSERLQDLFIAGKFSVEKIQCSQKALEENSNLSERAQNYDVIDAWRKNELTCPTLLCLNVRSIRRHLEDIENDHVMLNSSVCCFVETWEQSGSELPSLHLFPYKISCSRGRGKGVAIYSKTVLRNVLCSPSKDVQYVSFDHVQFGNVCISYMPHGTSGQTVFLDCVAEKRPSLILGDMNQAPDETESIFRELTKIGYSQHINVPTHLEGRTLDHLYTASNLPYKIKWNLHSVYFTDHEAVCVQKIEF